MIADTKQENLSWRGDFAYLRKKLPSGRETWKSLGKLAPDDARRIVRHMVQKMSAEDLQVKLGLISRRSNAATIGEVIEAYEKFTLGIVIELQTIRAVKNALRRVVRAVKGEAFDVDRAPADILTAGLVKDYSAVMIAARKAAAADEQWDQERIELELGKVQRSIRSNCQQARSMFSAEARKSAPFRALELPDLKDFLEVKVGESTIVAYDPPAAEVLKRIRDDVPELKKQDPAAWLAMMLEINGGLRRGSAALAKWDWFVERGAGVVDLAVRVAKGGHSLVRFDWELYQEMKALRQDLGEFIVPGLDPASLKALPEEERSAADAAKRQEPFDRLLQWLRSRGMQDRRAPNHELRKWFGDEKYQQHGATEAQNALGHSSPELTGTVYSARRTQQALRIL